MPCEHSCNCRDTLSLPLFTSEVSSWNPDYYWTFEILLYMYFPSPIFYHEWSWCRNQGQEKSFHGTIQLHLRTNKDSVQWIPKCWTLIPRKKWNRQKNIREIGVWTVSLLSENWNVDTILRTLSTLANVHSLPYRIRARSTIVCQQRPFGRLPVFFQSQNCLYDCILSTSSICGQDT